MTTSAESRSLSSWQSAFIEVKPRISQLFQSGLHCDCRFSVGRESPNIIKAHKLILAIASPVFEAMFYGEMAEKDDSVPILDIEPQAFKALLEYIYTDNINIASVEEASGLYYGAKKYLFVHLAEKCVTYLIDNLDAHNVCQIFDFATFYEENFLKNDCIKIFRTKTLDVIHDPNFIQSANSTILFLFSMQELAINNELELFEVIEKILTYQENEKTEELEFSREHERQNAVIKGRNDKSTLKRKLLENIRFLTLTSKQFADGPAKSSLLNEDEAAAIFDVLTYRANTSSMPVGFFDSRNARNCYFHEKLEVNFISHIACQEMEEGLQLVSGSAIYVCNTNWRFRIKMKKNYAGEFLIIELRLCTHESCTIDTEAWLLCWSRNSKPYYKKAHHCCSASSNNWYTVFSLRWTDVLHPEYDFVQDGKFVIEWRFTVKR